MTEELKILREIKEILFQMQKDNARRVAQPPLYICQLDRQRPLEPPYEITC